MANDTTDGRDSFVIPSRTLHGSKRDMVEDIDQAVVGLLALRHLIDDGAPLPDALALGAGRRPARGRLWWPRLLTWPRLVALGR